MMGKAGARVAINYLPGDPRGAEALAALRAEGITVFGAPGDVGDPASVTAMVAQAVADLGGLDLLVNNAGMPGVTKAVPIQDLDSLTEELWDTLLNVNLQSVFRVSKAAAPALKASKGAIVNTASIAGLGAVASTLVYSATKAGVINLTKNLARALAPEVRVNGVAPGTVVSPWGIEWTEERTRTTAFWPLAGSIRAEEAVHARRYRRDHPLPRFCGVDDHGPDRRRRWRHLDLSRTHKTGRSRPWN